MELIDFYKEAGIDKEVFEYGKKAEEKLKDRFARIDEMAELNQIKVLSAMRKERVSYDCLNGTTGYGYGDVGRICRCLSWGGCLSPSTDYLRNSRYSFGTFFESQAWRYFFINRR